MSKHWLHLLHRSEVFFLLTSISLSSSDSSARFQPGEMTLCADWKVNSPLSREVQVSVYVCNTVVLAQKKPCCSEQPFSQSIVVTILISIMI